MRRHPPPEETLLTGKTHHVALVRQKQHRSQTGEVSYLYKELK